MYRFLTVALVTTLFSVPAYAVEPTAAPVDSIVKASRATLYYYSSDGFRYVFPNEDTYFSWFTDFSLTKIISDSELSDIPLRANVPYRPGIRMLKIQTDPKTYAVGNNGLLRWVTSESAARSLYGVNWSDNVDDLPDAFFTTYRVGDPINSADDFNPNEVAAGMRTINQVLGIEQSVNAPVSNTEPGMRKVESSDLPPDLVPLEPYDIRFTRENGRTLLRFTSTFWNSGEADFRLTTRELNGQPPVHEHTGEIEEAHEHFDAFQQILQEDGSYREEYIGILYFHSDHDHYHFDNFGNYSLVPATASIEEKSSAKIVNKTTFCMRDDLAIDRSLPGSSSNAKYLSCGRSLQGVSVGWADVYPWSLPDQFIDVTDVEPGVYRLSFDVDPFGKLYERSKGNNESFAIVELNPQAQTFNILATGTPFKSSRNKFIDGTVVKSADSASLYVIDQNTKRQLRTQKVINSYGFDIQNAYVIPEGVIQALPTASFIRSTDSSAVYMLNDAGYKRRILNPDVLGSYSNPTIINVNSIEFDSYPETDLVQRPGSDLVYSVSERRLVGSLRDLPSMGLNTESVQVVNNVDFQAYAVDVISTGHEIPWDIEFLPNGDMILTERTGLFRRTGSQNLAVRLDDVLHTGEGGLMGIAIHPDFENNHYVYLYYTTQGGGTENIIERFVLEGNELRKDKIILSGIPASLYHDGGQLAFGPDGMLYVTTGDASQPNLAQDRNSLAGKTLRLTPDGDIPQDNPFGTAIWSYGHRNAQGLAWDDLGRLWETEHGRSGAATGFDELNLIRSGANYGWPNIQGDEQAPNMVRPVVHSGPTNTWAPSGIAFYKGSMFFAGLKGETLYQAVITAQGTVSSTKEHFKGKYGRLRAVTLGPDGHLYITTSNRDGRGSVRSGDDKILRIHPDFL